MEQTLVLKGVGVFATLIGVYQWMVTEAQPTDVLFILLITILLVLMDVEATSKRKNQNEQATKETTQVLALPKMELTQA